jgi:hypothetical protein
MGMGRRLAQHPTQYNRKDKKMNSYYRRISSSKQAKKECSALKSVWSRESYLTQRVLIYCAELLEQIAAGKKRKKGKKSTWAIFLGKQMRDGKSVKDAASLWRNSQEQKGERSESR